MAKITPHVTAHNGGARTTAGRKPLAATILRREMVANKISSAEYAFAFLDSVQRNAKEPTEMRIAAAKEILNRVFGKAVEMKVKDEDRERYDEYFAKIKTFLAGGLALNVLKPTRGKRNAPARSNTDDMIGLHNTVDGEPVAWIEQAAEDAGLQMTAVDEAINTLGEQSALDLLREQMRRRDQGGERDGGC